jgi:hypothetical protein
MQETHVICELQAASWFLQVAGSGNAPSQPAFYIFFGVAVQRLLLHNALCLVYAAHYA